jgi:dTDP-glucose pyrophosphorylase
MTPDLKQLCIPPGATLRDAIAAIDAGTKQLALVVEGSGVFLGMVTDGDIRRGLLHGLSLSSPVREVMNTHPIVVPVGTDDATAQRLMRERDIRHIPVVDPQGCLVDLALHHDFIVAPKRNTPVVLMAGGLGTRLRPLTETLPKPMIPIGEKPLLERIILRFRDQGFERFTLSVNYKAEIIRDHFDDGTRMGVAISYVDESRRMGTAGALSLIETPPEEPFIVMNGDILTTAAFGKMLDFHHETGAAATICAREFTMQVPYGVLNTEGPMLTGMEEKPVHRYLVNAGIYVLSPEVYGFLEPGEPLDMPDLMERLMAAGRQVSVHAVREYWMDIGQLDDLERARAEYETVFGP